MAQTFIEKRAGLAVDTLRGTRVSDEPSEEFVAALVEYVRRALSEGSSATDWADVCPT